MNSDEEKEFFKQYGWEYDYINRNWQAPDGAYIKLDEIVNLTTFFGEEAEESLKRIIIEHGKKTNSQR